MAFLPRNERFFELFEQQASLLSDAVGAFRSAASSDGADWAALSAKLAGIEQEADSFTSETIEVLSRTFITPLDSEDIHSIAVAQDDVIDVLAGAVSKWDALGVGDLPAEARAIANALGRMADANASIFGGMSKNDLPAEALDQLHGAKDEIVRSAREALRGLFSNGADPLEALRGKDLYDGLESVALRFNHVAHVVQGVLLKNA